ncbi:MAG: citrate synthase/methylcitrate synthase [Nitrososphaerota archaeon]
MSGSDVVIHKGLENIIITETTLSYIDGEKGILYYAGYPIEDLAKYSTFEEVCFLLWYNRLPKRKELDDLKKNLIENADIPWEIVDFMKKTPKNAHPMDIMKTAVSALGPYDPELEDNSKEANIRKAIRLQAKVGTITAYIYRIKEGLDIIPPSRRLGYAENFLYMMFGKEPDKLSSRIIDVALILHAEHELPASTTAALTTISTLSDIYSAIVSGIAALKGPLHGGANEKALEMLKEIKTPERAEEYIKKALAEKKRIMGFGHRVYKAYDPRARIFKEYFRKLCEQKNEWTMYQTAEKVEEVMINLLGKKGIFPNIDFYSGAVYDMLGIPSYLFTPMFAMARTSGWTAHVIEYLQDNRLIRPRAHYIGQLDLKYIPIEQRE